MVHTAMGAVHQAIGKYTWQAYGVLPFVLEPEGEQVAAALIIQRGVMVRILRGFGVRVGGVHGSVFFVLLFYGFVFFVSYFVLITSYFDLYSVVVF